MREYKIVRELDSGGMGRVYEGIILRVGNITEPVAIKIPNDPGLELRELFINEATTARRLNHDHPHLVTILDFGETSSGTMFLVMELIDGASVSELCAREPLPWSIARQVTRAMLRALDYLHRNDVVHRDLSSRNILLGRDNRIKLIDFGLIKSQKLTQSGRVCGTPGYSSPELLRGGRPSPASDLFSLGAVLYKMVTARRPFGDGENDVDAILARMSQGKPPLPDGPDGIPDDLRQIIDGLLEFHPENRMTSERALSLLDENPDEEVNEIGAEVRRRAGSAAEGSQASPARTFSNAAAPILRFPRPGYQGHEMGLAAEDPASHHERPWIAVAIGVLSLVALLAAAVAGGYMLRAATDHEVEPAGEREQTVGVPTHCATVAGSPEPRDHVPVPAEFTRDGSETLEAGAPPVEREDLRSPAPRSPRTRSPSPSAEEAGRGDLASADRQPVQTPRERAGSGQSSYDSYRVASGQVPESHRLTSE